MQLIHLILRPTIREDTLGHTVNPEVRRSSDRRVLSAFAIKHAEVKGGTPMSIWMISNPPGSGDRSLLPHIVENDTGSDYESEKY